MRQDQHSPHITSQVATMNRRGRDFSYVFQVRDNAATRRIEWSQLNRRHRRVLPPRDDLRSHLLKLSGGLYV